MHFAFRSTNRPTSRTTIERHKWVDFMPLSNINRACFEVLNSFCQYFCTWTLALYTIFLEGYAKDTLRSGCCSLPKLLARRIDLLEQPNMHHTFCPTLLAPGFFRRFEQHPWLCRKSPFSCVSPRSRRERRRGSRAPPQKCSQISGLSGSNSLCRGGRHPSGTNSKTLESSNPAVNGISDSCEPLDHHQMRSYCWHAMNSTNSHGGSALQLALLTCFALSTLDGILRFNSLTTPWNVCGTCPSSYFDCYCKLRTVAARLHSLQLVLRRWDGRSWTTNQFLRSSIPALPIVCRSPHGNQSDRRRQIQMALHRAHRHRQGLSKCPEERKNAFLF